MHKIKKLKLDTVGNNFKDRFPKDKKQKEKPRKRIVH